MASRDSAAYSRYDEQRMPVKQESKRNLRAVPTSRRRRRPSFGLSLPVCIGIVGIAAVYILFCQMQLTQLTAQVSTQNDTLDELTAENVSLSSKKINSMDMAQVEEYATTKLGMVKLDNSQIEYVELTNPDTVTVAHSEASLDKLLARQAHSFSALLDYIN